MSEKLQSLISSPRSPISDLISHATPCTSRPVRGKHAHHRVKVERPTTIDDRHAFTGARLRCCRTCGSEYAYYYHNGHGYIFGVCPDCEDIWIGRIH